MQARSLIFLDVDGVLNRYGIGAVVIPDLRIENDPRRQEEAARREVLSLGSNEWWAVKLQPECVARLDRIAQHADAIILSSTWKRSLQDGRFAEVLRVAGSTVAADKMAGITPFVGPRLVELASSLREHKPDRFVVLDDAALGSRATGPLTSDEQAIRRHHIKTQGRVGLTDDDVERAIAVLRNYGT